MANYTDPATGTVYTSPEVAKQYGVNVGTASSGVSIQQQTQNAAIAGTAASYGITPQQYAGSSYTGGSSTPPAMAESIARAGGGTTLPNPTGVTSKQFANPVPSSNSQVDTSQPNPNTVQVQPGSAAVAPSNLNSPAGLAYIKASGEKGTSTTSTPQSAAAQQAAALAAAKASGKAPQDSATGSTGVTDALTKTAPPVANTQPANSTPAIDNFFAENKDVKQSADDLLNFLNPPETTKQLTEQLAQIQADKAALGNLNIQLMNIDTIMNGTSDDIRKEVTAAGGFATESQVNALAVARNKTLLLKANEIQNKITTQQNIVANDTSLYADEKDLANTQYNQRSSAYQMAQAHADKITAAAQDNAKTIIGAVGYSGYVNSLLNTDPSGQSLAHAEQALGMAPGTLSQIATQEKSSMNLAQIQAAGQTNVPFVVAPNGEVWNTQTGYAYTSSQDFQLKTGLTLQQAQIKPLQLSIDQQTKIAQSQKAQIDAQFAAQIDQANINQSNASAASSAASAKKSNYELNYEQNNGGMSPADANKQGQSLLDDAAGYVEKLGTGKIDWNTAYNALHTKYPDADTTTLDNILQSNNYRR